MNISYCVTVCDELEEFMKLFGTLSINKRPEDNIIVLYDLTKGSSDVENYLSSLYHNGDIHLTQGYFNEKRDFSDWKNKLIDHPKGLDYLFFLDADEIPNPMLIEDLPLILELNEGVDVFGVARANFVEGITPEHIQKWGWRLDSNNRINYPDYQYRICKNTNRLKWVGKVHETIQGFNLRVELPTDSDYDLLHIKQISKQELQNNLYETL